MKALIAIALALVVLAVLGRRNSPTPASLPSKDDAFRFNVIQTALQAQVEQLGNIDAVIAVLAGLQGSAIAFLIDKITAAHRPHIEFWLIVGLLVPLGILLYGLTRIPISDAPEPAVFSEAMDADAAKAISDGIADMLDAFERNRKVEEAKRFVRILALGLDVGIALAAIWVQVVP